MDVGRASAELAGRVLLAHLFLISGLHKIGGYAVTQGYMEQAGLPGALLPLAILLELGGGVLLILSGGRRAGRPSRLAFSLRSRPSSFTAIFRTRTSSATG